MSDLLRDFNFSRYDPADAGGFYESYFQRANHPTRPLAFWIRYTVFSPKGSPDKALGELWAIWFDGERGRTVVAKTEVPAGQFAFARDRFQTRIGAATLDPGVLKGRAESRGHDIQWDLTYRGKEAPLFLMAPQMYHGGFPKAKVLVGQPLAAYNGTLAVDDETIQIQDWIGSQNHNWGPRHTDQYAYGQVAGFDNAPDSFLELATGRLRMGPVWTPFMTPLVLRHGGQEFGLRTLWQALARAHARFGFTSAKDRRPTDVGRHSHAAIWEFRARLPGVTLEGAISAPKEAFVGLRYYNPPGGEKYCLNSKIASCRLKLKRDGRPDEVLETKHRAAFEILTDDLAHGIEIRT